MFIIHHCHYRCCRCRWRCRRHRHCCCFLEMFIMFLIYFCFFNSTIFVSLTTKHILRTYTSFFYIQTVNIQKTPCYIHILSYGMERQSNELCYDSLRLFWYVGSKTNNITRNTRKFFFQIYSMKCEIFKFPTFNRTNSVPTLRM